jgi:hypothetical protein
MILEMQRGGASSSSSSSVKAGGGSNGGMRESVEPDGKLRFIRLKGRI